MVDGLVELAERGVDAELPEQGVHAEGPGLVGDDRHHPWPERLVAHQVAEQVGHRHRGGHRPAFGALGQTGEYGGIGQRDRAPVADATLRDRTAEGTTPLDHVLVLVAVLGGPKVGGPVTLEEFLGDLLGETEPFAQGQQLGLGHLLDLVGGVAGLEALAEGPALDGLGEDDRGGLVLLGGGPEGGVDLLVVVAAARHRLELFVGEVFDHGPEPRVGSEEVLADVGAGLDGKALVFAVDGGVELVEQDAVDVPVDQLVPLGAPDDLDDVPAGATEHPLEFLDDLTVATYRPVEALQVAVDDPDEVAEAGASGQGDGTEGFGFVAFAVAEEAEDAVVGGFVDVSVLQVPVEPGVVDGVDRAEPHRHGRELPEVGHEAGVWIARQAAAADLHAEAVEVRLVQAAFEERPGVDAGGGMALVVDVITGLAVVLAAEEPVEADLVERSR